MEAFGLLMHGFAVLLTWKTLLLMMVGLVLGIFVGVLPGLGGPNGVAILLPLTFTMDPTSAIVMLSCIYWGALFGGAITSILFNIPGEAWSVATTFDGYPMAQQGKAPEALTAAFTSSFIGSLAAVLLITFLAPGIAAFALQFGPPEFFAVYLLTFCSFVGLGREDKHKTIISMTLGLLLAGIGMDTVSGTLRMTFGWNELLRGINFLVAVIGLFGISEILLTMEERLALRGHAASISLRVVLRVWKDLPRYWVTLLRSSAIGCWLGITPGGAIAAFAIQNAMFDVWLMLLFGVVGYVFKKVDIPLAPFTLALVLGNRAEASFRQAMIGSAGDLSVFWSNWLVGSITTLALLLLFWPLISQLLARLRGTQPAAGGSPAA